MIIEFIGKISPYIFISIILFLLIVRILYRNRRIPEELKTFFKLFLIKTIKGVDNGIYRIQKEVSEPYNKNV